MKILLITDMEGVAGISNISDWCEPPGMHYVQGCRLLTLEVNAVVEGFFNAGAQYVQVADAHGYGGIDVELLDPRVEYARGWDPQDGCSYNVDPSFTGIAWVGQHAKASTEYANLAHTQNMTYIDQTVNKISIGEFGQTAMCATEVGVPAFFGSGDLAFTKEAEALVPGIVTCAVKRGLIPGSGEECTVEEYKRRNEAAIHQPPGRAREIIRTTAETAARRLKSNPPQLISISAPFERVTVFRPETSGASTTLSRESHDDSIRLLMGLPFSPVAVKEAG